MIGHTSATGTTTYGKAGYGAVSTTPGGASYYHPPVNSAYPAYGAYHPPVAVPYYGGGCYGCAAAAGAVVGCGSGVAAGACVGAGGTAVGVGAAGVRGVAQAATSRLNKVTIVHRAKRDLMVRSNFDRI